MNTMVAATETKTMSLNEFSTNSTTEEEVNTCDLFYFMVNGIFGILICAVGLTGNILSFWIIKQMNKKSVTFLLLRSLAIADALYLLFCLAFIVVPEMIFYSQALGYFYTEFQYVYLIMFPFISMALTVTTWVTCLLTLHR